MTLPPVWSPVSLTRVERSTVVIRLTPQGADLRRPFFFRPEVFLSIRSMSVAGRVFDLMMTRNRSSSMREVPFLPTCFCNDHPFRRQFPLSRLSPLTHCRGSRFLICAEESPWFPRPSFPLMRIGSARRLSSFTPSAFYRRSSHRTSCPSMFLLPDFLSCFLFPPSVCALLGIFFRLVVRFFSFFWAHHSRALHAFPLRALACATVLPPPTKRQSLWVV